MAPATQSWKMMAQWESAEITKITVNQATKGDAHPIPRIDELFAKLSCGKVFSKSDLSHAYQQLVLEENSREYVTINTHRGLFQYTRLPFGITTAPAIFQRTMESLLAGIPGVIVYLDDILVTGDTIDNHFADRKEMRAWV